MGLFVGQSDAEALSALWLAFRRLLRSAEESWYVWTHEAAEGVPPMAHAYLCDSHGRLMKTVPDDRHTLTADRN